MIQVALFISHKLREVKRIADRVTIMRDARVFGEIDIDSDVPAAFTARDREFLEEVARLLAAKFV